MPRKSKSMMAAVARKLEERGLDVVEELAKICTDSMALTSEEVGHEAVAALLGGDYELAHNPGNPSKPWMLRARTKLRSDILKDLLQYTAPKLRATESHSTIDNRIEITLIQFPEPKAIDDSKVVEAVAIDPPHELPERRPIPRTRSQDVQDYSDD